MVGAFSGARAERRRRANGSSPASAKRGKRAPPSFLARSTDVIASSLQRNDLAWAQGVAATLESILGPKLSDDSGAQGPSRGAIPTPLAKPRFAGPAERGRARESGCRGSMTQRRDARASLCIASGNRCSDQGAAGRRAAGRPGWSTRTSMKVRRRRGGVAASARAVRFHRERRRAARRTAPLAASAARGAALRTPRCSADHSRPESAQAPPRPIVSSASRTRCPARAASHFQTARCMRKARGARRPPWRLHHRVQ